MRALLVYPEWPDTYWSFKHALPFEGKRSVFPPLGLLTVASLLPQSWEQRLVDVNIRPVSEADLKWADVVLISAMLVQKESMLRILSRCRARGLRTVVGGPISSCMTDLPLYADHVVVGEAEELVSDLAADLEHGTARPLYQAKELPGLNTTPLPKLDLINPKYYSSMAIQYSRGCPFNCEFCDIIEIYGRKPRAKSPAQIVDELEQLYSRKWRGPIFIVDDNFIGNKRKVKELLPVMAEWNARHGRPFTFYTEASVNLADDQELLQMMKNASFDRVFLGIETPAEESLKEAQKSQNRGNLLESVKKIQSYGMEVMAGFIVGFDNDPIDIFERQIDFIRKSAIPLAMVGLLNALPDTQLWKRLEREGRLLGEASGNNTVCTFNFKTRMDPALLIQGYQTIMRTIYSPREYYERALASMKRTAQQFTEPNHYNVVNGLASFARIFVRLGVIDRERKEFWRFFTKTLFKHHTRIAESLRLAAMGYHFRKLSDAYSQS